MSDFIRRELVKVLEHAPRHEILERLRARGSGAGCGRVRGSAALRAGCPVIVRASDAAGGVDVACLARCPSAPESSPRARRCLVRRALDRARSSSTSTSRTSPRALVREAALAARAGTRGRRRASADRAARSEPDSVTTDVRVLEAGLWEPLRAGGAEVDIRRGDLEDPLGGVIRVTGGRRTPHRCRARQGPLAVSIGRASRSASGWAADRRRPRPRPAQALCGRRAGPVGRAGAAGIAGPCRAHRPGRRGSGRPAGGHASPLGRPAALRGSARANEASAYTARCPA